MFSKLGYYEFVKGRQNFTEDNVEIPPPPTLMNGHSKKRKRVEDWFGDSRFLFDTLLYRSLQ